jgi:hypothetical protein
MDAFRQHEMQRFVVNRGSKEDSSWYARRIKELDSSFKVPTECIPEIIPYLRIFYSFSDSHDKEYLDDRILYYESMIQYETIPRVPKNVLRRRKIENKPVD